MADNSKIEWTDASWNPIRSRLVGEMARIHGPKVGWHCEHATPGCEKCYAEAMNKRLGTGLPFKPGYRKDIEIFLDEKMLLTPLNWSRSRMVFVCSMTDLFADFATDEMIDRVFAIMAMCPHHTFQVLTKRASRMFNYMNDDERAGKILEASYNFNGTYDNILPDGPPKNVWLGVSVEDQTRANERIPLLMSTPAAVRFISAEPLLAPIDLTELYPDRNSENAVHALAGIRANPDGTASFGRGLDWVIIGGESGRGARPFDIDWARSLIKQCQLARVSVFMKQLGSNPYSDERPMHGNPKGKYDDPARWPPELRVRQFPTSAGSVSLNRGRQQ